MGNFVWRFWYRAFGKLDIYAVTKIQSRIDQAMPANIDCTFVPAEMSSFPNIWSTSCHEALS